MTDLGENVAAAPLARVRFLTARWSNLALVNYRVPEHLLAPRLPPGCRFDDRDGSAWASLVAFDFLDARVLGLRWPGFVNFPEVNLRFYVRRDDPVHGVQRGVVFVREFVPQRFVAAVARWTYNEPYQGVPMSSRTERADGKIRVAHRFTAGGCEHGIAVAASATTTTPPADSEATFFKEHQWGFGTSRRGRLIRYQVRHPAWAVYDRPTAQVDVNWAAAYGPEWAAMQGVEPASVVLAVGSAVSVYPHGRPPAGTAV